VSPGAGGGDMVILARCSSTMEAAAMQAYLEANGVRVYVQGANHRALIGAIGTYIDLNVMVAEDDLERGRSLLLLYQSGARERGRTRRRRSRPAPPPTAPPAATTPVALDPAGPYRSPPVGPQTVPVLEAELAARLRRTRTLAIVPSFGAGHLFAGAPVRALGLAALEMTGVAVMFGGDWRGALLCAAAAAADFTLAPIVVRERLAQRRRAAQPAALGGDVEDDQDESEDENQ